MKFSLLIGVLICLSVFADPTPLPRAVPGIIRLRYVNAIQSALTGTVVPRNSLGNAGDSTGSLGLNFARWKTFRAQTVMFAGDTTGNVNRMFPDPTMTAALTIRLLDHLPLGDSYLTIDQNGYLSTGEPFESTNTAYISGAFTTNTMAPNATPINSSNATLITNLSLSMFTYGNPVRISLHSKVVNFNSYDPPTNTQISGAVNVITGGRGAIVFFIDGAPSTSFGGLMPMGVVGDHMLSCGAFNTIIPLSAGPHTIEAYATNLDSATINAVDCEIAVNELF